MNEMVHIGNSDISIKEYNGQRVVTFKDIDMVHGRPEGTARKRFADNRNRFIEGQDFFIATPKSLENAKMSEKRTTGIEEVNPRGTALITEQGYLMLVKSFTDDLAWDVQRQLVNGYFKVKTIVNEDLTPQTRLILELAQSIANKELEDKERDRQIALANETAEKAVKTTESIKEAVKPVFDNWRVEINAKFNRIQKNSDKQFNILRTEMYSELERRAGCDLNTRLRNKRNRMIDNACKKSEIDKLNKMDIIEEDKKLREIFSKIVTEYEIKYCA